MAKLTKGQREELRQILKDAEDAKNVVASYREYGEQVGVWKSMDALDLAIKNLAAFIVRN